MRRFHALFIAATVFLSPSFLHAVAPVMVTAIPAGPEKTELIITNQSDQTATPFDISLFCIATGGFMDSRPANWVGQDPVNAPLWEISMGSVNNNGTPTWHQYTSLAYTGAFPTDPIKVLGFYLNYSYNAQTGQVAYPGDPIRPGSSLRGFIFQNPASGYSPNLTFFVAGPDAGANPFTLGNVRTFSGQTVPEPGGLTILGACAALVMSKRRRLA